MRKSREEYLWKRFRDLLPNRKEITSATSCMVWGFAVGDGWYKLIKELMLRIETLKKMYPEAMADFEVAQVKEKFGGLRFYVYGCPGFYKGEPVLTAEKKLGHKIEFKDWDRDSPIEDAIRKAEEKSFETCEDCGKPGELRSDRWWFRTLCDFHSKQDLDPKRKARLAKDNLKKWVESKKKRRA